MSLFQNTVTRRHLLSQGERIESAFERFDKLEFKQFLAKLKKQKNTPLLRQPDEWGKCFNNYCTQCTATDQTIDKMVYELYGLTKKEIQITEN